MASQSEKTSESYSRSVLTYVCVGVILLIATVGGVLFAKSRSEQIAETSNPTQVATKADDAPKSDSSDQAPVATNEPKADDTNTAAESAPAPPTSPVPDAVIPSTGPTEDAIVVAIGIAALTMAGWFFIRSRRSLSSLFTTLS